MGGVHETSLPGLGGGLGQENIISTCGISIDRLMSNDHVGGHSIQQLGIIQRWLGRLKTCLKDQQFADELARMAIAATIFISIVMLMTLAQMFSDRWFAMYARNLLFFNASAAKGQPFDLTEGILRGLAITNGSVYATDPLFDHVSALLPDASGWREWLSDAFLTSFLGISLTITLIFPKHTRIRYQSIVVVRRMMWILSILYMFRMWSFLVTTVPNPVQNCIPKYPQTPSAYLLLMGRMATGKVSACTDNIYSGHTTLATVLFYTNLIYARRWYFSIYSLFHSGAIIFMILLTRLHYSVDILIALFMTSFVYCTYHFLLLVHIDQRMFRSLKVNGERLMDAREDPRFLEEQRLLLRLTGENLLRLLAWMDGMDLRTASVAEEHSSTRSGGDTNQQQQPSRV